MGKGREPAILASQFDRGTTNSLQEERSDAAAVGAIEKIAHKHLSGYFLRPSIMFEVDLKIRALPARCIEAQ